MSVSQDIHVLGKNCHASLSAQTEIDFCKIASPAYRGALGRTSSTGRRPQMQPIGPISTEPPVHQACVGLSLIRPSSSPGPAFGRLPTRGLVPHALSFAHSPKTTISIATVRVGVANCGELR